jgi:hypothetical protein
MDNQSGLEGILNSFDKVMRCSSFTIGLVKEEVANEVLLTKKHKINSVNITINYNTTDCQEINLGA